MDGDSTISIREVKMEDGTPSATDLATASPHPPTATSTTNSHTADNDDRGKAKPATSGTPYRSWKKKHQKMRIAFEEKMELNAKLHAQEVMAIQTSKRLAVEIDRVLDLLLDVNNSPQIPGNKRIDIGLLPSDKSKPPSLDIDQKGGWEKRFYDKNDPQATALLEPPTKSLQTLLHEVRHVDLATAKRSMPLLLEDLEPGDENKLAFVVPVDKNAPPQQQQPPPLYPESFLSADDIDNYLWEVDRTVAGRALLAGLTPPPMLPTLAPFAHTIEMHAPSVSNGSSNGNGATSGWDEFFNRSISNGDLPSMCGASASVTTRDSILRNPTSVFNWLKKNAPKAVFLQEGEATAAAAADKENNHAHAHANGDEYHHYSYTGGGGAGQNGTGGGTTARGRKSAGGGRGGARGRAKPMAEVVNAASDRERVAGYLAPGDADSDGDLSFELTTPRTMGTAGGRGGKRKRAAQDDDSGYRPKAGAAAGGAGGSGRGTKRKRKSEGGAGAADAATASPSTASTTATKKARKSGDGVAAAAKTAAAAAAVAAAAAAEAEAEAAAKTASTAGADGEDTEMASGEGDVDVDVDADADTRAEGEDLEDVEDDEDGDASVVDQEAVSVEA